MVHGILFIYKNVVKAFYFYPTSQAQDINDPCAITSVPIKEKKSAIDEIKIWQTLPQLRNIAQNHLTDKVCPCT